MTATATKKPFAKNIRYVSFDADDTLWDFQSCLKATLLACNAWLTDTLEQAVHFTIEQHDQAREKAIQQNPAMDLFAARRQGFANILDSELGVKDDKLVDDLCAYFFPLRRSMLTPFDDVLPTFERLHQQGYQLAWLSNGNSWPKDINAEQYFAAQLNGETLKKVKPHKEAFEQLFGELNCRPHEVLHIGDSLSDDYHGAVNAGAHALLLDRNDNSGQGTNKIRSLSEVVPWLSSYYGKPLEGKL